MLIPCTSGLLPDYMHVVHLSVGVDLLTGMLLEVTDDATVFQAPSRSERLTMVWEAYVSWAEQAGVEDRAGRKLFTTGVLTNSKVVEVSQKILSATACRYLILWSATFMNCVCESLTDLPATYECLD